MHHASYDSGSGWCPPRHLAAPPCASPAPSSEVPCRSASYSTAATFKNGVLGI